MFLNNTPHSRYTLLTVDTEALPKRAKDNHIARLIWGEHENGQAGIREMCALGQEVGAKHIFFTDMCAAHTQPEALQEVVRWLDAQGQDVQLHTHPEYLPEKFWQQHGFPPTPAMMNRYDAARAQFVITHFKAVLTSITGKPPQAFRAGSFRWNADTLHALAQAGIAFSFNNTMGARERGQNKHSLPTNMPFLWNNGIIEVPATEMHITRNNCRPLWARLQFPENRFLRYRPWWCSFFRNSVERKAPFLVYVLHSWSLLTWDEQKHATYVNDEPLERYRKLLRLLSKDYDIITTQDLLELVRLGKISLPHTEPLPER